MTAIADDDTVSAEVVLPDGRRQLLLEPTTLDPDQLRAAVSAFFAGVSVLFYALSKQPTQFVAFLDSDPDAVAAATLLTKTLLELKGEKFDLNDYR